MSKQYNVLVMFARYHAPPLLPPLQETGPGLDRGVNHDYTQALLTQMSVLLLLLIVPSLWIPAAAAHRIKTTSLGWWVR